MTIQVQSEHSGFEELPKTLPPQTYQLICVLLNRGKVLDAYALLQEYDLDPGEEFKGYSQ